MKYVQAKEVSQTFLFSSTSWRIVVAHLNVTHSALICAPHQHQELTWEISEAVNALTAFPDAPDQVKELCNKRKIAFAAETGTEALMWWNQSGRSKAAKTRVTVDNKKFRGA